MPTTFFLRFSQNSYGMAVQQLRAYFGSIRLTSCLRLLWDFASHIAREFLKPFGLTGKRLAGPGYGNEHRFWLSQATKKRRVCCCKEFFPIP